MKLPTYGVALATLAMPVASYAASESVYIRCDDGKRNPDRIGVVLNETNNTVGITEHRRKVAEVSAVSFGPTEVKFTIRFMTGDLDIITVSRVDATISSYSPLLDTTWNYKGCGIVEAPSDRAF